MATAMTTGDVAGLHSQLQSDGDKTWTDDSGDGATEPLLDVTGYAPVLG